MNNLDLLELAVTACPAEPEPAAMLTDELVDNSTATFDQAAHHVATIRAHADGSAQLAQATDLIRIGTRWAGWLRRRVRWMAGLARNPRDVVVVLVIGFNAPVVTTKPNSVGIWPGTLLVTVGAEWVLRQWWVRRESLTARARLRGEPPPRFAQRVH